MIWQIASATGWTVHYILWRINYQTLQMMLSDAPRYEQRKAGEPPARKSKGMGTTALFQSLLKNMNDETC